MQFRTYLRFRGQHLFVTHFTRGQEPCYISRMDITTLDAYAAGLFDGEGTVGIRKGKISYNLEVQFHMTDKPVLDFMRLHYGGSEVHLCKRYPNRRQAYRWNLWCQGAANFLLRIQPFLIVKKDQVAVAIEFSKTVIRYQSPTGGFRKRTEDEIQRQHEFYLKLASMKLPT